MSGAERVGDAVAAPATRARWGRQTVASACVAITLLGLSAVATWSSFATSGAARTAERSGQMAGAYSTARFWVGAEESLERQYRLEPGPEVLAAHDAAEAGVNNAMARVAALGTPEDRAVAADVRQRNADYDQDARRVFQAVDRGDTAAAVAIDHGQTDAVFSGLEDTVFAQAAGHAQVAEVATVRLQRSERVARWATSFGIGVGLLLVLLFTSLRRHYGRESADQARRNAHQATHDALTGLPNRLHFTQALDRQLAGAERVGGSVGVALLDLDRFKEVNDTLGHHTGDRLLQQIGPRIRDVLRAGELMARLGGDEFALLMPIDGTDQTTLAAQQGTVQRVLAALHAPFMVDDIALTVEASVGLACFPHDGHTGEVLLQRADIAMYTAKASHQSLAVYDRSLDAYNPRKLTLLADLRQAVDRDELVLYYQPLVDFATYRVRGVEALVRWQHPRDGLLPPGEFVPLAEGSGFIHELTRHVITLAVRDAKTWEHVDHPLEVSVNISARCLLDTQLPETIDRALTGVGLPAGLLKLEITESAIMADPTRAQDVIHRLHNLGVALSIDDFGTGYTSLAYLRDLPVQELKIDRSFVMRMLHDHKDAVIVRTAVELAERLGLDSVAEGIDDAATFSALRLLGCTTAQGFHLSPPLPTHDLNEWIETWNRTHPVIAARAGAATAILTA